MGGQVSDETAKEAVKEAAIAFYASKLLRILSMA